MLRKERGETFTAGMTILWFCATLAIAHAMFHPPTSVPLTWSEFLLAAFVSLVPVMGVYLVLYAFIPNDDRKEIKPNGE